MKFIQKLCFSGETEEALEEYKKAFGCSMSLYCNGLCRKMHDFL